MMKKITAFLLALVMLLSALAACSEETESAEIPSEQTEAQTPAEQSGDATAQTPATTETPDEEPHYRHYDNPYQEAIVAYAHSMLDRKVYIQYDDSVLIDDNAQKTTYRWQRNEWGAEDYNRQFTGYTNCAAFTYDVYYQALDYDILDWSTYKLMNDKEIQVYFHSTTGTETEEEKAKIKEEYLSMLEPGDIVLIRYTGNNNGHAMLYVGAIEGQGEQMIIHSATPGGGGSYDYDKREDLREVRGSLSYMDAKDLFNEGHSPYFWNSYCFAICRPLKNYDKPIPEKTVNRVKNLQGVYVEKLATKTMGQNVNPGEEITYSFEIRNGNKWKMPLEIVSFVPEYTSYVSGGDTVEGNKLSWSITVPKGETVKLEYTVKVSDDQALIGKKIVDKDSTVGGVNVCAKDVYIGRCLNADETAKMTAAVKAAEGSELRGAALVNKIYTDALGRNAIDADSEKAILGDLFVSTGDSEKLLKLNKNGKFFGMIAPGLFGGHYISVSDAFDGLRTRGPQTTQLIAGDILIMSGDVANTEIGMYIYTGESTVLSLMGDGVKLLNMVDTQKELLSTLGHYKFAILRPSLAF